MRLISLPLGTGLCRISGGLLILAAVLSATSGLFAQSTGIIRGQVTNQATGELLPGAQVRIEGTAISTYTDRSGVYRLTAPGGSQVLVVTFTGLDPERIETVVEVGQTVIRNVSLTSEVYALDEFAVMGLREGSALAIQMQRQSTNFKNVAATDTFGNPAVNPGELIQRLPGITTDIVGGEVRQIQIRGMDRTFNSVMLDGSRVANAGSASYIREVQIEQMGTHSIETVEVIKAPTPDMDADAIAGFVNLISKRAFDRPGRRITYNLGTVWKVREDSGSPEKDVPGLDLMAVSYSDVYSIFGADNNLGISVNALRRKGYTLQDEVQHAYRFAGFTQPGDQLIQTQFRTREFINPDYTTNLGFSADYKLSDDAFVFFRTTVNRRDQYQAYRGGQWVGSAAPANYQPGSTYEHTIANPVAAHRFDSFSGNFTKKAYNYSLSAGGEHNLAGDWKLNYDLAQSYASTNYPDRNDITARVPGVGWEIDRRNRKPWYPAVGQIGGPDINDPLNFRLQNLEFFRDKGTHTVMNHRVDLRKDFDLGIPAFIKLGAKWGQERRVRDWHRTRFTYLGPDGIANSADDHIAPYVDPNYRYAQAGGRYGPWVIMQVPGKGGPNDIEAVFRSNPEYFEPHHFFNASNRRQLEANFRETIQAGYIMGNINFGSMRVLGGLRLEETRTRGETWANILTAEETQRRAAWVGPLTPEEQIRRAHAQFADKAVNRGEYRDVFPGVHVVYEPIDGLITRASWNTSITRPGVNFLLPSWTANEENQTVTIGNPALQPHYSNNFEVGAEKYFEPVGLFGAGVFLKEIDNYSRVFVSTVPEGPDNGFGGDYAGWELRQRRNVGSARIRGFELNYQQQLSFLPGFWRGFGVFGNYTWLEAMGDYGGTAVQTRLAGLTPQSGNYGVSYVNYGLQVRLMANYRSRHPRGGAISPSTLWRESRTLYDFKVQYALRRNLDLFFDAANLGDAPGFAQEYEFGHKQFQTKQGVTLSAGVMGRF